MAGLIMDEAAMDVAESEPSEDQNSTVLRSMSTHLPIRSRVHNAVEMSTSSLDEGARRNSDGLEAGLLRNDFLHNAPPVAASDGGSGRDLRALRQWASTMQLRSARGLCGEREAEAAPTAAAPGQLYGSTSAPLPDYEANGAGPPPPSAMGSAGVSQSASAASLQEEGPSRASAGSVPQSAGAEVAPVPSVPLAGRGPKGERCRATRGVLGLKTEVPRKEPVAQVTECACIRPPLLLLPLPWLPICNGRRGGMEGKGPLCSLHALSPDRPGQFFVLRKLFGYDPASYAESVSQIGAGRIKGGRSGAFFFITQDQRLIMKVHTPSRRNRPLAHTGPGGCRPSQRRTLTACWTP